MFSIPTRPDEYNLHRHTVPSDPQRLYTGNVIPRSHPYSPVEEYSQRRPPSGNHLDYSVSHALPAISTRFSEMSRIDTTSQYTRSDEQQLSSAPPISASSLDLSAEDAAWSPTQPTRSRKSRREKPRIELAPDQPPTTQGKPRARVYVACIQCRTRKIRCDGAKPICHNCGKRSGSHDCNYDSLPKRRGPDKNPGARQRVARKSNDGATRPRRRNTSSAAHHEIDGSEVPFSFPSPSSSENTHSPEGYLVSPHERHVDASFARTCPCHGLPECPSSPISAGLEHTVSSPQITVPYDSSLNILLASPLEESPVSRAFITGYDDEYDQYPGKDATVVSTIATQPSVEFSRKIWWDSLLSLYLSNDSRRIDNISVSQRNLASQRISADLRFLFRASNYWFSFVHVPSFFSNFYDPPKREQIQPSLILAALALSTFWQSSEIGLGHRGRTRALLFRDEAQSALEASYNAGCLDDSLAQAAWMLAMFEVCAHPHHSSDRSANAMVILDAIIRALSLTMIDADDPNTSIFSPGKVPGVAPAPPVVRSMRNSHSNNHDYPSYSTALPVSTDRGCSCLSLTLKEQWPQTLDHTPLWAQTPAWNTTSEAELRRESCRRLCWSAMILAAGHSNYAYANRLPAVDLFIADPSNYALLFSGETIVHSPSAKDTIWALHDRAVLLWQACIKLRNNVSASVAANGQFAIKAWLEADAIEEALNRHTCGIERASVFIVREYIFNTRMCITYEFQRFVPLPSSNGFFQRKKAEDWLTHQAAVAHKFTTGLHNVTGNSSSNLSRRPFFVFWLMSQVSRGLTLWQCDKSLTVALDVCKNFLVPIDQLSALWPCSEQRQRYDTLRDRLRDACILAHVSPPPPPNWSLPPPPSAEEFV